MVRSDQMAGTITVDASFHWCYKHVQMDIPSISGARHLVPLWSLNGADNECGTELNRGEPYEIRARVFGGTFPGIQSTTGEL